MVAPSAQAILEWSSCGRQQTRAARGQTQAEATKNWQGENVRRPGLQTLRTPRRAASRHRSLKAGSGTPNTQNPKSVKEIARARCTRGLRIQASGLRIQANGLRIQANGLQDSQNPKSVKEIARARCTRSTTDERRKKISVDW